VYVKIRKPHQNHEKAWDITDEKRENMKNLQKMKYSTHPIKSKMIYSLEQGIEP
jgi:hypothetical protein